MIRPFMIVPHSMAPTTSISLQRSEKKKRKVRDDIGKTKGSKRRKETKGQTPKLYQEDLGMVGVRKLTGSGPQLSGPERQKFSVPRTKEERKKRHDRKARFESQVTTTSKDVDDIGPMSRPLASSRSSKDMKTTVRPLVNSGAQPLGRLIGTNENLEKPYLRLTTFPKPECVRPPNVLIRALAHIKRRYFQEEDFEWANEQLKSVRQDITVQRIYNDFVLDVYETHARILLEHGDLNEFNQCQSMIQHLTTSGWGTDDCEIDSSSSDQMFDSDEQQEKGLIVQCDESIDEFRAYSILYALVQNSFHDLSKSIARALVAIRQEDECKALKDKGCCIKTASSRHALLVVQAVTQNDYRAFFRLYESAHHLSAYLLDFLVKRMREKAIRCIVAAYRPTISVEFIRECLHFHDLEETRQFLRKVRAVFIEERGGPPSWVDCKASKLE